MAIRTGRPSMLEAVTLGLVATGAVSIAVAAITGAVGRGVEIFGSPVVVDLPVHDAPLSSVADAAGVASASYTESVVSLDGLDAGVRWLFLMEVALPALSTVIVCMSLWWLGLSLIRQLTFRRSMAPVLGVAAIALVVAGLLGPMFGAFGRAAVVEQLTASGADTGQFWSFLYAADLSPVGWGIVLALITTAFEVGQRLQRETEGLV